MSGVIVYSTRVGVQGGEAIEAYAERDTCVTLDLNAAPYRVMSIEGAERLVRILTLAIEDAKAMAS